MTRFRPTVFEALCNAKKLFTDEQIADALGVSQPHVTRMNNGECGAGPKVIDQALKIFAPITYLELFEQVPRQKATR